MLVLFLILACGIPEAPAAPPSPSSAAAPAATEARADLVASLLAEHEATGAEPAGAITVWLKAAMYAGDPDPGTREAGLQVVQHLSLPLKDDDAWQSRSSNQTFKDRLQSHRHVFRSYAVGATPENNYAVDPSAYSIVVDHVQEGDPRGLKVFVVCNGADSPRPVYLKKSTQTGLYYLNNYANLYVDVRAPYDPSAERFE